MFDLGIQVLLNCYSKQLNVNTEDTLFSSLSQNKEVLFFYFPLQQLKISFLKISTARTFKKHKMSLISNHKIMALH